MNSHPAELISPMSGGVNFSPFAAMYFLSLFSGDCNFLCNDLLICYFFIVIYTSSPIVAHHLTGSIVGIRGYTDFHFPHPTSLYYYDDEERTSLIHKGSAQIVRELVSNALFSDMDRTGLPKPHFIFEDIIDIKDSLLLPLCP